jgi:glycosyltransferase involved in cell wall biosynthesis
VTEGAGELVSVVVSTYNRPDALAATLRGLSRQTDRDFEVVVADDGSGPSTAEVVCEWKTQLGVPLHHAWQEDRGFRAAEVRNRAVAASSGAYYVFIDGDCIPRADFVAAHRRLAERGTFVAGNRALMSAEFTARVLRDNLAPETWSLRQLVAARIRGDINRLSPLVRLPLGPLREFQLANWRGIRSANQAIRRDDFVAVDGYDADFSAWGLEDSDIVIRLIRSGVKRKNGNFATGVLHLWHPERERAQLPDNEARLRSVIVGERIRATRGLSTLVRAEVRCG